jgi:hypothetical protein
MDEMNRTIIDTNGGWGGNAWGAGLGAFVGAMFGNGGFGWGGNRFGNAGVGYDTGAINAIQEQLGNVQTQIANADRDLLMQASNQNQFVGNLVNQTGDAIVAAVTNGNQNTQAAICGLGRTVQESVFQNTLSQTQNANATNLAMCQGFGGLNANIAQQGFNNQLAIVEQNGANRLQAQELAAQQQQCCCQVLKAVSDEGCANRELQREIQTQAIRDKLAETQAELSAQKAQSNLTAQLTMLANQFSISQQNQTQAIINALKPATTTGA